MPGFDLLPIEYRKSLLLYVNIIFKPACYTNIVDNKICFYHPHSNKRSTSTTFHT